MYEPNVMEMIEYNDNLTTDGEITLDKFNIDKIKLTRNELKLKYYGFPENCKFRVNKDYLKILSNDDYKLFKAIYDYIGDIGKNLNLFELICRFGAFKCAKYLSDIKYQYININVALCVVGINDFTSGMTITNDINKINSDFSTGSTRAIVIPPEKYVYMSEWLILKYIDNITDFNNLFIMFVLTGKVHLLRLFSSYFNVTNDIASMFLKIVNDTELIKWIIDKMLEKGKINEENCDLILLKFDFELWKYLYEKQEYDHTFHKLIPLIAERTKTIDFAQFICNKLDVNDALYLNIYEVYNCYPCNEIVIEYMKMRGIKMNIVRPDCTFSLYCKPSRNGTLQNRYFSLQKLAKLYVDKIFTKENRWIYTREDITDEELDEIGEENEIFDFIKEFKWKRDNIYEIYIIIDEDGKDENNNQEDQEYISLNYKFCDKIVLSETISIDLWEENEESILLTWKNKIDNYHKNVDDIIKHIYTNAKIE